MKDALKMIATERLHPNLDNPRKALGDLTELSDSIKKNGVMQNLTVIPQDDKPGEYMIVMGHRRHAAAVQAGLKELPCRVMEKLERSDQVAAMLAENLQRSNLTPFEEGQGFQLMLDLGETEATIAEKTGFGKTTIRHRINIAKLDQSMLKARQDDESFQLNITDLIALEKVSDIEKRNEILGEAKDSRDLAFLAQRAENEIRRKKNLAKAIPMLEKAGVKPAPDKASTEIYDSRKWQTVETIDLESDLPETYQPKQAGELFYYKSYREIKIIKRAEKKKSEKPKTQAEKERQEQEAQQKKNRKQLLEAAKEADAVCRDFILSVANGKIAKPKAEDMAKAQIALWQILYNVGAVVSRSNCISFQCGKDYYAVISEEREEAGKWIDKLDMVYQMLIIAYLECRCVGLIDSNGGYNAKAAERAKRLYTVLRIFGLRVEKEAKLILDGKHELYYTKPAEKPVMIEDKVSKAKGGQKPAPKAKEQTTALKAKSLPNGKAASGTKAKVSSKSETGTKAKAKDMPKTQAEIKAAPKDGTGAEAAQEISVKTTTAPAVEPMAKAEVQPEMESKHAETGKAEPQPVEPGQTQNPATETKAA